MKLSVEAKVAAAVAAGLMVMSSGAMAQGHKGQPTGSSHFGPTSNPGVSTHMNQQGEKPSLFGPTNAEENKPTVSDEKVTESGRQRRDERRMDQEQRQDRRENFRRRDERRMDQEQRQDRRENVRRRDERKQDQRQRERRQEDGGIVKSPFAGSLLDANPSR
jgi:hypothetical protein